MRDRAWSLALRASARKGAGRPVSLCEINGKQRPGAPIAAGRGTAAPTGGCLIRDPNGRDFKQLVVAVRQTGRARHAWVEALTKDRW